MGISKTEINLRRLLAATTKQQNQAKLIHVCAYLLELKFFYCFVFRPVAFVLFCL